MKLELNLVKKIEPNITHFSNCASSQPNEIFVMHQWVMRKWFDFSKKEIVRLFIIRINGGFFSNYFLFWKVEYFRFWFELFPPYRINGSLGGSCHFDDRHNLSLVWT